MIDTKIQKSNQVINVHKSFEVSKTLFGISRYVADVLGCALEHYTQATIRSIHFLYQRNWPIQPYLDSVTYANNIEERSWKDRGH